MSLGRGSRDVARQSLQNLQYQGHSRAMSCLPSCSNVGASTSQRAMSSSAPIQAMGRRDTAQTKRLRQEEEDAKLRKAIELYHLAGNFFPSRPPASTTGSAAKSSTAAMPSRFNPDEVASDMDGVLDALIKNAIKPAAAKELYGHFDKIQQKTIRMKTALEIFDAEQNNKSHTSDWDAQKLQSGLDSDARSRDEAQQYLNYVPQLDTSYRERAAELPDVDDGEAVKAYIATVAREQASDAARSNRSIDESLDTRSSRVRDALFGTVDGSRPGLEVVRERATLPSVQEMAERLRSEQTAAPARRARSFYAESRLPEAEENEQSEAAEEVESEGQEAAQQGQGAEQSAVGQTI